MKTLNIQIPSLPQSSYNIYIGSGIIAQAEDIIIKMFPAKSIYVITDSNVENSDIADRFCSDKNTFVIKPAGEVSKNMKTVIKIVSDMEEKSLGRDAVIAAVGGGTVGDIAGFAAAIFKRGIPVIQIPTTTVSQADSAVGGKTGVDSHLSKNAFGIFHHPSAVIIDVQTLKTLDNRQFNAGLVESIKHGLIADEKYFNFIEENIDKIMQKQNAVLEVLAENNCRIKGSVVSEDPLEKNKRRILNYGHTIGHAVESASNFNLLHGEAVGIGILAANLIEINMGIDNRKIFDRVKILLKKLNLPTKIPADLTEDILLEFIRRDKKAVNKWPKFVLLEAIAKIKTENAQWAVDVPENSLCQALQLMY